MTDTLGFVFSTLLAAGISTGAAMLFIGRHEKWKFLLAAVAGFPLITTGSILLTGTMGILTPLWVNVLLLVTGLGAWCIPGIRSALHETVRHEDNPPEHEPRPLDPVSHALAIAMTAAFVAIPILRAFIAGTNFGSDDFSYHAPGIAGWVLHNGIVLSPYDYHAYYPFNAEAFGTWFVLPFHSDGLIGIAGAYWLSLLWLATIALVLASGGSRVFGFFAGALVSAPPLIASMATRISSPDIAGGAMVVAAMVFLAPDSQHPRPLRSSSLAYAGLLLGFALGSKVGFGIPLAIALLWVLTTSLAAPRFTGRLRAAGILLLCSAVTGAGWYVRNWYLTGNPLFPAQVGPFAGPFTPAAQARTKLITWILERPTDLKQWALILRALVDWPPSLFAVSCIGYAATLWQFFPRRSRNRSVPLQTLLFASGLLMTASFLFLPFSGTDNEAHGILDPKTRFLVIPFAIGVILFSARPILTNRERMAMFATAILAIIPAWGANMWFGLLLVPAAFLIPRLANVWQKIASFTVSRRAFFMGGTVLLVITGFGLIRPFAQRMTDQRVFEYGSAQHPVGKGWKALDGFPAGSRIAWFANKPQEYYPLFGRGLSLIPVPLDPSGVPYKPLHALFKEEGNNVAWWGEEPTLDSSAFLLNIRQAGVDYILVTKWEGDAWPPQQRLLEQSGLFSPVYADGYSTVWGTKPIPGKKSQ
jgi:hypothetical protein